MHESRAAIEALIFAYAERLDAGDFAGVGSLFQEAGYGAEGAEPARGAAAVEALLRDFILLGKDGTPGTLHLTTNLVIEIDEPAGTATARSCFSVFQPDESGAPRAIALGRYRDAFVRENAGWRFDARRIRMEQTGDLSRHLRRAPGP